MSTPQPSLSIPNKVRRKSSHRRTDSGELDVFEAERYFSAESLPQTTTTTITIPQRIGTMKSTNPRQISRASLGMPRLLLNPQKNIPLDQNKETKKKVKHKQPNSPGGKLASFFNSLINQTVSKKKKPSKSSNHNAEQEIPDDGWRTRRRNSITTTTKPTAISDIDAKSIRSSSSLVSGFRTPPPYMINTPIKPYKKHTNSTSETTNPNWFREEFRFVNGLSSSSAKDLGYFEKKEEVDGGSFKGFMEDDGDDSDSSSDLFELQLNYDHHHHNLHHKLGYCASDLPVYETTHLDTIKISSSNPITINGRFRN